MAVDRDLFRLALCLLLSIQFIDARECKIGCLGKSNPLYNLESGKAYSYAFEGKAETTLAGATDVVSTMGIKAQVVVTAGTKCENFITVKDVQVTSDRSSKVDLKDTVVKFGMQSGKIEDLCVDKDERTYSLNIKRAILSLLQTSLLKESGSSSGTEIDIHGSCPTRFDFSKTGNSLTVRKSKDLNRCAFRENYIGALSPSPYLADSDIQTSHLMSGSLTTVQTIEGGVLKEAKSEETYSHNGPNMLEAPAKTVIKSSLVLSKSAAGGAPAAPGNLGKSLIFDAGHGSLTTTTEQELTKDIEHLSKHDDITEACASSFNNLVRKLRKADATQIGKVDAFCGADKKKKTVFMDALFGCGSSDCVYYIAELMTKGDIKDEKAKMWFARVGFANHAHPDALKKISALIKEDSPTSAFLGVGMLAGKYCKQHPCKLDPSMEDIEKSIASPLLKKGCKVADKKSEDKVIASLKGLTNINYLTKTVADAVIECATNKDNSNRIRAAALDTLRSDAHNPTIKEAAAKVFNTDLEDSELRIKAYLVLAECPCGKVATWVKDVLESEKSYQVGSFIVSHLRNVRASADPKKESLKKHLGSVMTTKRYPFDFRKFSQNYEVSYNVDLLNMGTIAESNVIYSQHSFIPRTLSLNLTSQLFGQSFNWLQVDARLENVERALEKIFGAERFSSPEDRAERMKEKANEILEKIASKMDKPLRPKREASDSLRSKLKALATKAHLKDNGNNVDIDLSLKTGGAQFAWMKYHSDDQQWETDNMIDSAFDRIEKVVDGAKSINMNYKRYMALVDVELQYATGLGLPIVRSLNGAVGVTLKVDGKLDIPAILRDPKNTDIKFQLIPSAAIDLVGSIIIDGIKLQSGVQLHSVAHTSTGSDISFRILDGTGIDVKLGLPVDKQQVLNFKTSFQKVKNNFDVSDDLVFNVKREKYEGCFDQLGPYVGLIFCGKADAPWEGTRTLNPAYGPINLKVSVNKEDPSLSAYHFRTTYTKEKNAENSRKFEILLDTPGTKTDRKLSLIVEGAISNKKYLKADLKSPWTSATFDSYITSSPSENIVFAKLKHDDSEYLVKGGFTKTKSGNAVKYEPVLEYKAPEFKSTLIGRRGGAKQAPQTYTLTGAIIIEPQDKENKITVQGLTLHSPRTKFTLDGIGSYDSNPITHLRGDYKLSWDKENVQVKFDYDKPAVGPSIKLWLSVLPSQYRDFGIDVKYEFVKKNLFPRPQDDRTYELRFSLTHGPDPANTMSRISVSSFTVFNLEKKTINTENKASYPVLNLEGTQFLKKDAKSFKAGLKGKLDRYSGEIRASGDLGKKEGEYNLDTMAEVMGNTVDVKASRKVLGEGQAKYQNSVELKPGGKYELNMNVNHKKGKESKLQVNTEVVLPADPKLIKVDLDYQNKEKSCSTSLKAVAGAKELINAEMKLNQGESFKANLKLLDLIDGQVDSLNKDSKIKSKMAVSFPRIDKKMEGTSEIVEGLKSGNVAFNWDTKDPKKSIIVEYNNDISWKPVNIVSKSSLNYQGSVTKLVVTYKGEIGDDVPIVREIELLLPDGDKLSLGGQGTVKKNGEELLLKFKVDGSCTHPDGKSSVFDLLEKISVSGDMSLNDETDKYKGQVGLALLNKKKEDFDTSLKFDVQDISDTWHIKTEAAAKGKLMENKDVLLKLDAEVAFPQLKYTWSADLGKETKLNGKGAVAINNDKASTIDAELSGKLPETSEIKTFKWTLHHKLSLPVKPAESKAFKLVLNNDLSWNDKFVKHGFELGMPNNQGLALATELKTPTTNKKLTGSANWADGDPQKADISGILTYDGKTADLGLKLEKSKDNSAGAIHVIVNSAETGKVHLVFKHKTIKEKNGIQNDLTLSIDDKKIAANSVIELVPDHPLVDINIDYPDGKSKIYLKNDRLGDRHWKGENKLKWTLNKGGSFNSDYEADFQSLESFSLKANVDAPEMKLNKMQVDISNKNAKQIAFSIKNDGKTVSAGNLDYEIKNDGGNYIITGKGVLNEGDRTVPVNFEYKSQTKDGQRDAKWSLDYGKMRYSSKYETNQKHFYMDYEHCLDKDCAKSMYENKLEQTSNNRLVHEVKVVLDLRPISLEVKHPISFHSKLSLDVALPLEQQVELKWSKNGKLKYHAEIKEKGLAVLLHTPKRVVGVESKIESPKDSKKIETSIWFDKAKGDRVTIVSTTSFVKGKDTATFSGETKISHKSLGKDYVVKGSVTSSTSTKGKLDGELILDIFEKSEDKIVINVKNGGSLKEDQYEQSTQASLRIDSCKLKIGLERQLLVNWKEPQIVWTELVGYTDSKGSKREIGAKFELNRKVITGHVKIPGSKVLEINGKINDSPKTLSIEGTTTILKKQYKNNLVINTANSDLKYTLNFDGKTINCEASAVMGQKGRFKVSFDNKDCASLEVALDEENFLKSTYNYNTDAIKGIFYALADSLSGVQKDAKTLAKQIAETEKKEAEILVSCLQKKVRTLTPLLKHVNGELNEISEEILQDEYVKALSEALKKNHGKIVDGIKEIWKELVNFASTLEGILADAARKVAKIWKEVSPKLAESLERISNIVLSLVEESVKISKKIVDKVLDEMKKHEKDIKEYLSVVTDFIHEIGKQIGKVVFVFHDEMKKIVEVTLEQLKDFPLINAIKEKYNELKQLQVPEEFWGVFLEIQEDLKNVMPTKESADLVEMTANYLEKIIKQEKFDIQEASVKLLQQLSKAITSIVNRVSEYVPIQDKLKSKNYLNKFSFSNLLRIPKGGIRVSLLRLLISKDLPSIYEFLSTYHLSLKPLDNVPPFKGLGLILEGSEIITFDGRHISFKGSCDYVLASDYLNNNFSVVAHVKNGVMEGLSVSDGPDYITFKAQGQSEQDGRKSEFPMESRFMSSWIRPHSVGVYDKFGVLVICSRDLTYCEVSVNGFYFDRTRGLLGNMNYEKYDDLLLPNGQIAADDTALANGWKLSSCPDIPATPHTHSRNELCTKLLTKNYELAIGMPWAPVSPFRAACDHLTDAAPEPKKEEIACKVAQAYVRMAQLHGAFFLRLPSTCTVCPIDGTNLNVGQIKEIPIKLTKADIVFVVEGNTDNEENFVQNFKPLVKEITNNLASQNCKDVRVSVVTFNTKDSWPHYHSSKGDLYGNDFRIKFVRRPEVRNDTRAERMKNLSRKLIQDLGLSGRSMVYADVLQQDNFRPDARKIVIGMHSTPCIPRSLITVVGPVIETVVATAKGIVYHVITPFNEKTSVPTSEILGVTDGKILKKSGEPVGARAALYDDICVEAATLTGGYAFPLPKPEDLSKIAKEIASSENFENVEMTCTCGLYQGLIPSPTCYRSNLEN